MNRIIKKLAILVMLFSLFLSPSVWSAGGGKITGVVKDASTAVRLPGANVIIVGTALGTATDLQGEFVINGVPPGNYTLRITYIGYQSSDQAVTVRPDQETRIEVLLTSTIIEGEVVVVSAQREGQIAAINQQLTSDALVNIVSSEKILEVPDANAAESIARLPGVSIQRDGGEGARVAVRGLSPKYSKVMIDGIEMASTSELSGATDQEESRSTNLSALSQENLKGIELFKAPTADMDGDAIGGTVNLRTAPAESKPERIIRGYGSYNSLEADFKQYDIFGKVSQRFFKDRLGLQLSLSTEQRNRSSDLFSGAYRIDPQNVDPVTGYMPVITEDASVEDRLETRKRTDGSLILDYDVGQGNIMLTNFYSKTSREIYSRLLQISSGGEGLLRTSVTDRSLEQIMNALRGEHRLFGIDINWKLAHSFSRSEIPFEHRLNFTGPTPVPTPREVSRDTSAIAFFNQVPGAVKLSLNTANPVIDNVEERNYIGGLDFGYDFTLNKSLTGYLKFGGKVRHLERNRNRTRGQLWAYLTQPWLSMTSDDFLDDSYKPHNFLNGDAELGTVLDAGANRTFYEQYKDSEQYVINEAWESNSDYEISEDLTAFYLMMKLNYKQLITFIPGIRFEGVDNEYLAYTFISTYSSAPPKPRKGQDFFIYDTTANVKYHDWMPMVHLKIKPVNWFDLRLSLTKTISRPDFNDLMPYQTLTTNPESSALRGNPDLNPVRAINYDAYASFYDSFWGLLTIGAFYKSLDGVSVNYRTYLDRTRADSLGLTELDTQYGQSGLYITQRLTMPINLDESTVQGVEFEIQTNLRNWPVPGFLKGFVLGMNYSIMTSKTTAMDLESKPETIPYPPFFRTTYIPVEREIPVPGQADRLMNLSLGYDIRGFSARVSMFYQSGSLRDLGVLEEQDGYDDAFTRWDLSVRQNINSHLDLYFNVVNLTETRDRRYVFRQDRPTRLESFGRTADLGVQIRL